MWMDRRSTAARRDCVYWLAEPTREVTCVFALDVRTGWTWTTELPVQCPITTPEPTTSILFLSMSSDGRLSLIQSLWGTIIQVWVLSTDDDTRWTRQRTIPIDVNNLLSHCPPGSHCRRTGKILRSRCVVAKWSDQELLVDIESGSSHPRVRHISYQHGYSPYEMDS